MPNQLLLLLLLLLLPLIGAQQTLTRQQTANLATTHYGNCFTADYGAGRCVYRNDCDFYDVDLLDASSKRQCYSQQRPELVCCPREQNALPALAARISNKTAPAVAKLSVASVGAGAAPKPLGQADALPQHPHCGTSFAFKVYGGNDTGLLEFPWTTLLEYTRQSNQRKEHACGATFIAQRWLLTAAHCVHEHFLGADRLLTGARLGEWNQSSDPDCITLWNGKRECAPPHIQAQIERALMHPEFELGNLTHDIALLRLKQAVDWRQLQHVEPVCLPPVRGSAADQLAGSAVDVSGWGLNENSTSSVIKQKAMLYVLPQSKCRSDYEQQGYALTEGQLCASGGINVDSCSGDSGGPLTVEAYTPQRDRFVYLAGIVSYGKKRCGRTDFPGVYTRVSSYMDWIEQTIRDNSDS
ncbi:Ser7 [Drosophila busckii]|uniref:Ser7 n=1 Tax=Drosophila busckii TaxID=30019 RepID=A0A0M5J0T4_DROBS|nr:serine protease easter [Drosophila busckii]ALC48331.1 Ser7 [Drosophila busckii]